MKKSECYELKDIILGLRGEYQKQEERLQELSQNVIYDDSKISDVYFSLFQVDKDYNPELICNFIEKKNKIQKLIDKYIRENNYNSKSKTIGHLWKNFQDRYIIDSYYYAAPNCDCEFTKLVSLIMESEFTNHIQTEIVNPYSKLDISYHQISLSVFGDMSISKFDYNSREDGIEISGCPRSGAVNKNNFLTSYLSFPISKELFSEYHQHLIDEYLSSHIDFTIEENLTYEFDQIYNFRQIDDKNLVLCKKRRQINVFFKF